VSLCELWISQLRCLEAVQLELAPGLTLIWGGNGSGKTSVLEAIFLLGRGRSFRIRNNNRLIRHGQDHLRVTGQVAGLVGDTLSLAVQATPAGTTAWIEGRTVDSLAELSRAFAVQVIDPGIHRLIEEAGHRRRRWLDWAVFHVEPQFVDNWIQYVRVLKQRNAALKRTADEARVWDPQLARLGELITRSRRDLMRRLEPYWHETVATLSGLDLELHYQAGWNQEHTLAEALGQSWARDVARELTHAGPHRADVAVRVHGRAAREVLSRGQQKLVAAAMTLAQLKLLRDETALTPTLLLDDPAAELDRAHLERFITEVLRLRCQLVLTSLHAEPHLFGAPERTFCMEEGRVQPV